MMITSLGYHTFTIYMKLTLKESLGLYEAFAGCKDVYINNNPRDKGFVDQYHFSSKYYNIKYRQRYKGLSWTLRYSRQSPEYMRTPPQYMSEFQIDEEEAKSCSIKATINPKMLLGLDNCVAAADSNCLDQLIEVFNHEARKISPILKDFNSYSLNRTDYCINFDLADLRINCFPEDYMVFIKQSDIPNNFSEYKEYRGQNHKKRSGINSFYLKNKSVHINCYCKNYQLQKQNPSAPYIDTSLNIIRFEIQCLYHKTRYMQKQIKDCDNFEGLMAILLSDEYCKKQIMDYYHKTIGKGDYYTLIGARDKVKSMKYKQNKENRLIDALNLVNQHRGVVKANSQFAGKELKEFKRTLDDLGEIGINPVTIPRELRIKHLPNLMEAYLAQREEQEAAWAAAYPKNV